MAVISVRNAVSIGKHDQISDLVFFDMVVDRKLGSLLSLMNGKSVFVQIFCFFFVDFQEFINLCEKCCACVNCEIYD